MPRVNQRRTKSAPNRGLLLAAIAAACLLLLAGIFVFLHHHQEASYAKTAQLHLGQGRSTAATFKLEKATSETAQAQGLSGRAGLAPDTGMLFTFDDVGQHCMWMKDMRFNLDILWIDSTKRVTSIVANLNPTTYPQQYCATGKYVIEVSAGTARTYGLRVGQILPLSAAN